MIFAKRGFFFRFNSTSSLLVDRKAISLPEKKAEKSTVTIIMG
jgi:hypothetical protein